MSIIVNKLFKNTAIVLTVFAFFAFVIPQAAFAIPTITLAPAVKVDGGVVEVVVSGLTDGNYVKVDASFIDETPEQNANVADKTSGYAYVNGSDPVTTSLTLQNGKWNIIAHEAEFDPGPVILSSTTGQVVSVASAILETILEVEIHDDAGNILTTDAPSEAKIKPGYDVYVTFKADGPKVESSDNLLTGSGENLSSILFYDSDQLTFEEYQRADGTDNALDTILTKNEGNSTDLFQNTTDSITYEHYTFLLPLNEDDVDPRPQEEDAYYDDSVTIIGKKDYIFYGSAYEDSGTTNTNLCENQYGYIKAADFPTLTAAGSGSAADFADFDCVGYRHQRGQAGTVAPPAFPGTGEAFTGDDAAVLGRIKLSVPSTATEGNFNIITTAAYRTSNTGITSPVAFKENIFTLNVDSTEPTVTETALLSSNAKETGAFNVKVTFDETVKNVDINDFQFVETDSTSGTDVITSAGAISNVEAFDSSDVSQGSTTTASTTVSGDYFVVSVIPSNQKKTDTNIVYSFEVVVDTTTGIADEVGNLFAISTDASPLDKLVVDIDTTFSFSDLSITSALTTLNGKERTNSTTIAVQFTALPTPSASDLSIEVKAGSSVTDNCSNLSITTDPVSSTGNIYTANVIVSNNTDSDIEYDCTLIYTGVSNSGSLDLGAFVVDTVFDTFALKAGLSLSDAFAASIGDGYINAAEVSAGGSTSLVNGLSTFIETLEDSTVVSTDTTTLEGNIKYALAISTDPQPTTFNQAAPTFSDLGLVSDETYVVWVQAADELGNTAEEKLNTDGTDITFELYTAAPAAPTVATTVLVEGNTTDGTRYLDKATATGASQDVITATGGTNVITYAKTDQSTACNTLTSYAADTIKTDNSAFQADGSYRICAKATDPAGNNNYLTQDFTVDVTSPTFGINTGERDNLFVYFSSVYYLNKKANEGTATTVATPTPNQNETLRNAMYSLVAQTTACDDTLTYVETAIETNNPAFIDGTTHRVCASVEDVAGNVEYGDLIDFTAEYTIPVFSITKIVGTTDNQFFLNTVESNITFTAQVTSTDEPDNTTNSCESNSSLTFPTSVTAHTTTSLSNTGTGTNAKLVCFKAVNEFGNEAILSSNQSSDALSNFTAIDIATSQVPNGSTVNEILYTNVTTLRFTGTATPSTEIKLYFTTSATAPTTTTTTANDTQTADSITGIVSFAGQLFTENSNYYVWATAQADGSSVVTSPFMVLRMYVDTDAPTVTVNDVSTDNYINAVEKAASLTISGTTTAEDNQTVTVDFGGIVTKTATVTSGAWSVSITSADQTAIVDGAITVSANVSDRASNPATEETKDVTYDTTPPTLTIIEIESGRYLAASDSTTTDTRYATTSVSLGGADVNCSVSSISYTNVGAEVTGQSTNQVCFRVEDAVGNLAYDTTNNALEGLANTTLGTGVEGTVQSRKAYTNNTSPSFTATTVADVPARIELRATDGVTVVQTSDVTADSSGNVTFDFGNLLVGDYQLYGGIQPAGATDYTQLVLILELSIDTTLPTVDINDISTDNYVNTTEKASSLTISGTTTAEDGQTVTVDLGELVTKTATVTSGAWSVSITSSEQSSIVDGAITVSASTTDLASNDGSQSVTLTYDTTAPTLVIVNTETGSYIGAGDATTVETRYKTTSTALGSAAVNCSSLTYTDVGSSITGQSTNQVCFRVEDAFGNLEYGTTKNAIEGLGGTSVATGTSGTVSGGKTYTNNISPSFTSTTAPNTPARIELRDAGGTVVTSTDVTSDSSGNVSFSFGNISAGEYSLYGGIQPAGATDYTQLVTVLALVIDTAAPTANIDAISSDNVVNASEKLSSVTISGDSNAETGQSVSIDFGGEFSLTANVSASGTYTVTATSGQISSIVDNTYGIIVTVSDLAGNTAVTSANLIFDTVGPTISITRNTQNRVQSATYTTSATDAGSGVQESNVLYYSTSVTQATGCNSTLAWTDGAYTQTSAVTFNNESDNTKFVCAQATDDGGNVSYETLVIENIDTTAPTNFAFDGNAPTLSSVKTGNDLDSFDVTIENIEDDESVSITGSDCGNARFTVTGGSGDSAGRTYSVEGRASSTGIFSSCELTFLDEAGNASASTLTIDFAVTSSSSGGVFGGGGGSSAPVAFAPSNPVSDGYTAPQVTTPAPFTNQPFVPTGPVQTVQAAGTGYIAPIQSSLSIGDRGNDVRNLQKYLNSQGFTVSTSGAGSPGQESSYFGPATERALKAYQEHHKTDILHPLGLSDATGYAGSSTLRHINDKISQQATVTATQSTSTSSGRSSVSSLNRSLSIGDRGDDVRNLQKYLNKEGFTVSTSGAGSPGQESSYFGPATENAVKAYQEHHKTDILHPLGLSDATGYAGSSTLRHINENISQQTPATAPTQSGIQNQSTSQIQSTLDRLIEILRARSQEQPTQQTQSGGLVPQHNFTGQPSELSFTAPTAFSDTQESERETQTPNYLNTGTGSFVAPVSNVYSSPLTDELDLFAPQNPFGF